jgi:hypothetical protein
MSHVVGCLTGSWYAHSQTHTQTHMQLYTHTIPLLDLAIGVAAVVDEASQTATHIRIDYLVRTRLLEGCYRGVQEVPKECYRAFTGMLHTHHVVTTSEEVVVFVSVARVSWEGQRGVTGVSRTHHDVIIGITGVSQGCHTMSSPRARK